MDGFFFDLALLYIYKRETCSRFLSSPSSANLSNIALLTFKSRTQWSFLFSHVPPFANLGITRYRSMAFPTIKGWWVN